MPCMMIEYDRLSIRFDSPAEQFGFDGEAHRFCVDITIPITMSIRILRSRRLTNACNRKRYGDPNEPLRVLLLNSLIRHGLTK